MENAVIYARFSSHGQNEMTIEGQVRICREYAESQGYNVLTVYPEKARTGTNDSRPAFQKMIKDAASGQFQYIIVYMFDRFARNRHDSILYKEMLKRDYGIKVVSATQPISDDEGGEFYEMFLEWNDEKYSKRLSKRIKNGLDTCVENGTFTGSRVPFGYKLIDTDRKGKKGTIHKVAIDEEQAEIVRYIFNEYAKGTDKKVIADALNAQGKRIKGQPFKFRSFEKWLTNAKYTGEYYFGERLCTKTYPAIIDKLTFAKVQERLAENKHLAGANSAVEPYLLTGKLYCGRCGTPMVSDGGTSRNGKKHYYYACKKRKKGNCDKSREGKDDLEKRVTQQVYDFLSDKKNAEKAANDTIAYYERRTGDDGLKSIETRIAQAQAQVEELTNAFIEAKSPLLRAGIEKKMSDYEIMLADLQKSKAQILLERGRKVTAKDILLFIADLLKGNPADKDYQRKIIDNLVFAVYIYDDERIKTVGYLNLGVDESIEKIRLDETNEVVERLKACSNSNTLTPAIEWISSVYPSAIVYVDEEQTTKGHALNYGMQRICEQHPDLYDGFLIIDADCVLDSMFLCEMNRAFGSGRDVYNSKLVVKNYLNSSKNANSWASQCNGLIWTLMSELGNRAKSDLGIVTMTLGTGLLLRSSLVKQWNGWPFLKTLTEDMELQRCCALHHYRCEYVSYAVCYVEEATSLHATNLRRNRWMTGVVDCDRLYDKKLKEAKKSSQDKNNFYAIHSLYYVYFYVGFLLILFLLNIILGCVCAGLKFSYFYVFFIVSFLSFANLYLGLFIMTIRCMWVDRKYLPMSWMRRIWISLTHPFYYMGYIGIMTKIFTFKRTKEWKRIARVEFQESEA